jgi:hypothetical protein
MLPIPKTMPEFHNINSIKQDTIIHFIVLILWNSGMVLGMGNIYLITFKLLVKKNKNYLSYYFFTFKMVYYITFDNLAKKYKRITTGIG